MIKLYETPKTYRIKDGVQLPGMPETITVNGEGAETFYQDEKNKQTTTWLFLNEQVMYSKEFVEKNYTLQ